MPITDAQMRGKPAAKDTWITESLGRGEGTLLGRITPAGGRQWYYRYTGSKGQVRHPLGPYGSGGSGLSVAEARAQAQSLSKLMREQGITDLREHFAQVEADRLAAAELERQRIQAEQRAIQAAQDEAEAALARRMTVRQLFDRWRATLAPKIRADGKRVGRKDGGQYILEQFTRHVFPVIGHIALDDLRKPDLVAVLEAQTTAGKARTANVLLADLKQMFDYGVEIEAIQGNPLAATKKAKLGGADVARERNLENAEIKHLSANIKASGLSQRSQYAVWLILATGLRIGEAMGGIWADSLPSNPIKRRARIAELQGIGDADQVKVGVVDIEARTWYLPTTKNQRDHTVHLSDFAIEQLQQLQGLRDVLADSDGKQVSPWIFPARDSGRPVCVKSFGKQLADRQRGTVAPMKNRSSNTSGLLLAGGRWTAHDLRRTTGTMMGDLGFGSDVINECLNHVTTDRMARVYIRTRREGEQKVAFDALGSHLQQLTSGSVGGNVLPLRRA